MSSYRNLFEIGKALIAETDITKLLPLAMDKVVEQTKAQRGMITVLREDGELWFETARHLSKTDIAKPQFEVSNTIIRRVLESGESLVIQNALEDSSLPVTSSIASLKLLSVACAPLRIEGKTFGVIYLDNRDLTAVFDDETGRLLNEFATLISLAVKKALDWRQLMERQRQLEDELEGYGEIIGRSPAMKEVFKLIEKIAATDITVLITGETGTGKELVARALHRKSARAHREMFPFNCSTLTEQRAEDELFGHVRGAFTDARSDRKGLFEIAHESTVFLDEIADIPMGVQAQLLRVLQEGEVKRIGTNELRKVNVRVIAATNRNLEELLKQGQFREDLFYRLNVVEMKLPPLRERKDDLLVLSNHFLGRFAKQLSKPIAGFSREARECLLRHSFPGNVRELENLVQRAVSLAEDPEIQLEDLPLALQAPKSSESGLDEEKNYMAAKAKWERTFICDRLRETKGHVTNAARIAGMYKKNFIQKMHQHGIKREDFL